MQIRFLDVTDKMRAVDYFLKNSLILNKNIYTFNSEEKKKYKKSKVHS